MQVLGTQLQLKNVGWRPANQGARCHRRAKPATLVCSAEQTSGRAAPADTCPTCGVPKSEMASGCQGDGRIAGGLGAIPGFQWWPIKAYRPCQVAAAKGIQYERAGQILDELKGVRAARIDEIIANTKEQEK